MKKQYVLQMLEYVEICGEKHLAKIDTGASRSSIDKELAKNLGITDVIKEKEVKSSHGKSIRQIVKTKVKIGNRIIPTSFTLANRDELKFDLILGKNFLWRGFIIDTRRSNLERLHNENSDN
jgi:hypothetical protein